MLRQGSPICTRCGTRADARRGPSPICLACGQPFAITTGAPVPVSMRRSTPAPAPKSSSPVVWIAIGVLATVIVVATVTALVIARSSREDASAAADAAVATPPVVDAASVPSGGPSATAAAPAARALSDEERDELNGNYSCSLDDTPPFPCRVANGTLEKLAGSQRFRGAVQKLPNGNLSFNGTFFCPFGDCTRPVATTFVRQGPGRYVGRFGANPSGGAGSERVVLTKVR